MSVALRALSCFTGGYGLDLGLELAWPGAFEPVLYVEIDVQAAGFLGALQEAGFIPKAPIWSDINTVGDAKVRAYLRARGGTGRAIKGAVQVITGGYPCPDFSTAGKRKGFKGEKGKLWFSLAKAVKVYKPLLCFFENVGGHLRRGFDRVRDDLRGMGYSVTAGLFTAEEVGDTQKRERLFILACREGSAGRLQLRGRGSREAGAQPVGKGERLARPKRDNLRNKPRRCGRASRQGEAEPGDYGQKMAVCQRPGRQERQGEQRGVQRERTPPERGGDTLAGRGCHGRKQGTKTPCTRQPEFANCEQDLAQLPLFPPGPASLADWEDVLQAARWFAPAVGKASQPEVCCLAHGLARVDTLRVYGNGVVPLQAAYAFRVLCASAGIRIYGENK